MHGMEAKKEMKKTPVDIDIFVSQQLVKLTAAAYAAAKTEEARGEIKHDSKPGPLGLNRRQAKKYRIYEFSFGPDDFFEGEIKNIFSTGLPRKSPPGFQKSAAVITRRDKIVIHFRSRQPFTPLRISWENHFIVDQAGR